MCAVGQAVHAIRALAGPLCPREKEFELAEPFVLVFGVAAFVVL